MIVVYSRIDTFIEFVDQHIDQPVPTAEAIAQAILVSRSTLFRMVEKELGMSPFQYIRQEKLNKAKTLFEADTFDNIREMTYAVGYSRPDYFASIFMEAFGIDLKEAFK